MSDTPETDELEIGMDKQDFEPKDKLMPYADLCRKLERQLKEAREELKIALYRPDTESDQIGPCKRPDLCLLDHGHIPCPVCPNRKR